MKHILISLFLMVVSSTCVSGQTPQVKQENSSKKEAERLWELAIQAKGGREKLYSIRNMVVSSDAEFHYGFKKMYIHLEDLFVFPNKYWRWNDQRPSIFGLNMSMHNYETGKEYSIGYGGEPFRSLAEVSSKDSNTNLSGLVLDLLETKWNKPVPVRTFTGKVGKSKVNVVQTILNNKRIDFALDMITHLPLRVTAYRDDNLPPNQIRYSDYVDIDGFEMPSKQTLENNDGKVEYKRRFQFNVEYDDNIFIKPPKFESGREAWKTNSSKR